VSALEVLLTFLSVQHRRDNHWLSMARVAISRGMRRCPAVGILAPFTAQIELAGRPNLGSYTEVQWFHQIQMCTIFTVTC